MSERYIRQRNRERLTGKRIRPECCKRGHPFEEATTYVRPNGRRVCRICADLLKPAKRTRERAQYAANRTERRRMSRLTNRRNPFLRRAQHANARFGEKVHWSVLARISYLPCFLCGVDPAGGADHIVPKKFGGRNVVENIQPSCLICNQRKGAA